MAGEQLAFAAVVGSVRAVVHRLAERIAALGRVVFAEMR